MRNFAILMVSPCYSMVSWFPSPPDVLAVFATRFKSCWNTRWDKLWRGEYRILFITISPA